MKDNTANPVVLLGAAGLLGRAITDSFSRRACPPRRRLVALDRAGCDITNASQLQSVFEQRHPSVVINCAAITNVDLAEREPTLATAVNETAVADLASGCELFGTRLVHISTDYVFDGTARKPYQPTDPTNPISVYGNSKRAGERRIESIDPPGWLIVRTSWIFGDTGASFPKMILDRVTAGQPCRIVDDQFSCPTYAPDLAGAIFDLIDAGVTGVHHVANAGPCSRFEQARAVVAAFGLPIDRVQPISNADFTAGEPNRAKRPMYSAMADASIARPLRDWRESLTAYRNAGMPPNH